MEGFDPRQVIFVPEIWDYVTSALCGLFFIVLFFIKTQPIRLRFFWLILGQTILLTAPLMSVFMDSVWGAYPTQDKEASLLFFMKGVHTKMLFSPIDSINDSSIRLIGSHTGHFWVSELFALFLKPFAAMNMHALLNIVLSWWALWLLLYQQSKCQWKSLLLAFPFGMGLHLFRDINFYTIEKSALYILPLYWWALERTKDGKSIALPALFYGLGIFINFYWGILLAALSFALGIQYKSKDCWKAIGLSASIGLLFALYQYQLSFNGPQMGTPEDFLYKRAALDVFDFVHWNRIPILSAVHPVAFVMFFIAVWQNKRPNILWLWILLATMLSCGPWLIHEQIKNPLYLLFQTLPGMWRFAKPESFFHLAFMGILLYSSKAKLNLRFIAVLYFISVSYWLIVVRTNDVYPSHSQYVESKIKDGWEKGVFQEKTPLNNKNQ